MGPLAHGIGGVKDLPIPLWLFYYGAALVLLLSFLALWALWKQPVLARASRGRPLPEWLERIVLSPATRVALGTVGVGLLVLVSATALVGDTSPNDNLAPTFVYVPFWVGLALLVAVVGNVWTALNPWRAAADAVAWAWERTGGGWEAPFAYRERLGRWPGAVLLFAFASLELAYSDPSDPRMLALAVYIYSAVTWLGMLAYGREPWTQNGEAFSVYFGLLSRVAPFGVREGRVVVRWPFADLANLDARPGTVAFVAVMLGSTAFDGFSRRIVWVDFKASLIRPVGESSLELAKIVGILTSVAGLTVFVVGLALAYLAAVWASGAAVGYRGDLRGAFIGSLVPIALAYVIAHYFSLVLLQGQYMAPLLSDPFGFGWNLFGTADVSPNLTYLKPNVIWYAQVAALVVGHVAGLAVAHDRAVELFESPRKAVLSQYPMLVLMVVYTVTGLRVLSG
ncbi:MAG TPA: hypothetical protein VH650_01865 [Gaiellaceae bacterium]|jgi:hypothetical protein